MAIDEDPEGNEDAAFERAGLSFLNCRVLEIGCGDGRLTSRYAHRAASIIAIDPDSEAVAELATALPGVDTRAVSIQELSLPPSSVDVALFSWSL